MYLQSVYCVIGGINDEADSAATKRRHEYFEEALKPVNNYFRSSDRLIEVDVSAVSRERAWYIHYTLYIVYYTLYCIHSTLYIILCT